MAGNIPQPFWQSFLDRVPAAPARLQAAGNVNRTGRAQLSDYAYETGGGRLELEESDYQAPRHDHDGRVASNACQLHCCNFLKA